MHRDDPSTLTATHQPVSLPFVVRPAHGTDDLRKVAHRRAEAYGRHLPAFALGLRSAEEADHRPDVVVLLAESKEDRRAVGTVRLHIDLAARLPVEASVILPAWLRDDGPLVEPTRLAVEASACGALARNALLKACYLYAETAGAGWIVVTARRPLDRLYAGLLFRDVFAGGMLVPMRHVGNLPHRVLALPVREARALAVARGHRLTAHFFDTAHPGVPRRRTASRRTRRPLAGPPDAASA